MAYVFVQEKKACSRSQVILTPLLGDSEASSITA